MICYFLLRMAQQLEHEPEPFLADDFLQVATAPAGDLDETLRKSIVENVKVPFAELRDIGRMSGRRSGWNRFPINLAGWQFRFIDVDYSIKCIKNERAILHGFIV